MLGLIAATAGLLGAATATRPGLGAATPGNAQRLPDGIVFSGLTGGSYAFDDWRGQPILVANTASLCGFTAQLDDLQALYDRYRDRGLIVFGVPSNDFRQELATDDEVAEFCAVNFALDFPMASLNSVRGPDAHPFFRWLSDIHGFTPNWNFNKVLIGPEGDLLGTWRASARPVSRPIRRAVEAALMG